MCLTCDIGSLGRVQRCQKIFVFLVLIKKSFKTLLLEYRQLIAMPYISLTWQAGIYQEISNPLCWWFKKMCSHFQCQINILCFGEVILTPFVWLKTLIYSGETFKYTLIHISDEYYIVRTCNDSKEFNKLSSSLKLKSKLKLLCWNVMTSPINCPTIYLTLSEGSDIYIYQKNQMHNSGDDFFFFSFWMTN